jgi:hypothetical protein
MHLPYKGHGGMINVDEMLKKRTNFPTSDTNPTAGSQEGETVGITCMVFKGGFLSKIMAGNE